MGKKIEILEVPEGILLKPLLDPIKVAKGCLKEKKYSSQKYFSMKKEEKELEG